MDFPSIPLGLFTAQLDFGAAIFDGTERFLQIEVRTTIGDFVVLNPRQRITSAPYAIQALEATAVPMGAVTSDMLADGAVTSAKLASGAATQLGTPDGLDPAVIQASNERLLGIGTGSPQAGLDVRTGRNVRAGELVFEVANGTDGFTNLLNVQSVAASGDLLAVASTGGSAVTLFDVSDPAAPVLESQLRDGINGFDRLGGVRRIALSGDLLVISARTESAVTLVDVSDPANPTKLAELVDGQPGWMNLGGAMGVAVSGNLLAITAEFDDAVTLADISNPALPTNLGEIVNGQAGFTHLNGPVSALISVKQIYIGAWSEGAVTVADISDPSNPVQLATMVNGVDGYTGLQGTDGLALSGDVLAIVGNAADKITLVNVSEPASPVKLAEIANGGIAGSEGAEVPVFFEDFLGVTDVGENTLTLYDVSVPASPLIALRFKNGTDGITLLKGAYGLAASKMNLFVGGSQSLVILGLGEGEEKASLVTAGWVGIGTMSPTSALDVEGTVTARNFSGNFLGDGSALTNLVASTLDGTVPSASLGNAWKLGGNTGTSPGTDFLGTADPQPLELRVNNLRVMRFEENGDGNDSGIEPDGAPNVIGGSPVNFADAGVVGVTIAGGGAINWGGAVRANSVLGDYGAIGGGFFNTIGSTSPRATISGGSHNSIGPNSEGSTLGGGVGNGILNDAYAATISGGQQNQILANSDHGVIGGGFLNYIWPDSPGATVAGGLGNLIRSNALYSTIGGGSNNFVFDNTTGATIAGGSANTIGAISDSSTIGGGDRNRIDQDSTRAVIAGGQLNRIETNSSVALISGGLGNVIEADANGALIGGGIENLVRKGAVGAVVLGGLDNIAANEYVTIGGGWNNGATAAGATVSGGRNNQASGEGATVSGGGFLAPGPVNIASGIYSTVGGGALTRALADYATVAGGENNRVDADHGTIAGGEDNRIFDQSNHGFIGGGSLNTIGDDSGFATIAGGSFNTIGNEATLSVIGGGSGNSIGTGAVVATIPGGFQNSAGPYAFAAGYRAKANHTGAFVWADATEADFATTVDNQFLIRASGGVGINKNNPASALDVNGTIRATALVGDGSGLTGLNIPDGHSLDAPDGNPVNALAVDNNGRVGIGVAAPLSELHVNGTTRTGLLNAGLGTPAARSYHYFGNSDPAPGSPDISNSNDLFVNADFEVNQTLYLSGDVRMNDAEGDQSIYFFEDGGMTGERLFWDDSADAFVFTDRVEGEIFVGTSDRDAKEQFARVDVREVLDKVAVLPISTWQFKEDTDAVRHIGPVAQDFHGAFGLGHDDKHIATVDADGVALAAIQGLNLKLETELKQKQTEITELKQRLERLEQLLNHELNGGAL